MGLKSGVVGVACAMVVGMGASPAWGIPTTQGGLFGPRGGLTCQGVSGSNEPHGTVLIERTIDDRLVISITLVAGDHNQLYSIEIFEAADTCTSDNFARTGVTLLADSNGNGQAVVELQLPHVSGNESGTLGDGLGTEAIVLVLDRDFSGDRWTTNGSIPIPLPDPDSDGDGVDDADDECPDSDLSPTIFIGGDNTGITNELFDDGCSISDLIAQLLAADASMDVIVHFLVELKGEGIISGQDMGAMLRALNSP